MSPVDLTKCQPGDLLRLRSGDLAVYCGTDGSDYMRHIFCRVNSACGEYAYCNGKSHPVRDFIESDIVAIVRPTRAELEEQRLELLDACKLVLRRGDIIQRSDQYMRELLDAARAAIARAEATHE